MFIACIANRLRSNTNGQVGTLPVLAFLHRLRFSRQIAPPPADRRQHEVEMARDLDQVREVVLARARRRVVDRVAQVDLLAAGQHEHGRRFARRGVDQGG